MQTNFASTPDAAATTPPKVEPMRSGVLVLPSSLTLKSYQDQAPITASFILIEREDGTGYARMSFDRPADWNDAEHMGEAMDWFGHHREFHSAAGLVQVSARVWKYCWEAK